MNLINSQIVNMYLSYQKYNYFNKILYYKKLTYPAF